MSTRPSDATAAAAEERSAAQSAVAETRGNEEGEEKKEEIDTDDDEAEVVEESPCGRWLKRREEIKYRDVPGIDTAFLAMDSEEGVEVVWNEATFSSAKKFKAQEDKLKNVFEALTLIEHPNIVKFHSFWTDPGSGNERQPRLIFITEYMSSGSLKQFLRRTKKNNRKIQLQSWKRWCTQILSALSYLHQTCNPPIVHGNLTCDTIFIQHNGLVKIGSIAPDIIHQNVKTCRSNIRNLHYLAPEWGDDSRTPGTPSDVYSFGMCALETAALDLQQQAPPSQNSNGSSTSSNAVNSAMTGTLGSLESSNVAVTEETIQRTIDLLEDELQKDFIRSCLQRDPSERPTSRNLLFHPVLFEVHSLKLLAAHSLVNNTSNINETMTNEAIQSHYGPNTIMATVTKANVATEFKLANVPVAEKLEKFMEDVKFGIYPITAFALSHFPPAKTRAVSPEGNVEIKTKESKAKTSESGADPELRRISQLFVALGNHKTHDKFNLLAILILARFEDGMNRQLSCDIEPHESPDEIAKELVEHKFIHPDDVVFVTGVLADALRKLSVRLSNVASGLDLETVDEEEPPIIMRSADNQAALDLFRKLRRYDSKNPLEFGNVSVTGTRDPLKVTNAFPLPEGAYFCPPSKESDGSLPFKRPASGLNVFDFAHLEASNATPIWDRAVVKQPHPSDPNLVYNAFSPKSQHPQEEVKANLQLAQKALEGIAVNQQQEQPQLQQQTSQDASNVET